jgi:hypothetical protein
MQIEKLAGRRPRPPSGTASSFFLLSHSRFPSSAAVPLLPAPKASEPIRGLRDVAADIVLRVWREDANGLMNSIDAASPPRWVVRACPDGL